MQYQNMLCESVFEALDNNKPKPSSKTTFKN